jgi:hypothetical protein
VAFENNQNQSMKREADGASQFQVSVEKQSSNNDGNKQTENNGARARKRNQFALLIIARTLVASRQITYIHL